MQLHRVKIRLYKLIIPITITINIYIITNKIQYVIHKLNFSSHCKLIQIMIQSDEMIIEIVQVIKCINVKPKSEKRLGFLKYEMSRWLGFCSPPLFQYQHLCVHCGVENVVRFLCTVQPWFHSMRGAICRIISSCMPLLFQEQKHQTLVQLRNNVSTHKVATLVGMRQSFVAHLRKDVRGEI